MIISRTPLRISFAGGGTDLPAFYRRTMGSVVSTAINKYIYITVNKKFDCRVRASYSITEVVDTADQLRHELIREALRMTGISCGVEITSISDIPSQGTGLGSSSAYTVGLLNALYAYTGKLVGAERLAREACQIEIDICGKPIGKQDQYIAAYGGLKHFGFMPDETVEVCPVLMSSTSLQKLQRSLLLLFTGLTRSADSILKEQSASTERDGSTLTRLQRLQSLAEQLQVSLLNDDLSTFGRVLHEGWMDKRCLASGISTNDIDTWYERGLRHGAVGGKVLGAGGGGFILFYAPPERHHAIVEALPELRHVPIRFEPHGSRIIYVED
jgi:D-glycero-alpha-D-manno-heptose-7-phosphate kinase